MPLILFKRKKKRLDENIELIEVKSQSAAIEQPFVSPSIRFLKLIENFYIDPFENSYYIWLIINTIVYTYNLIFIIARASFWLLQDIDEPIIWLIMDYGLSDFIYIIDTIIKFFTGFIENGELCVDRKKIANRYLKSLQFKLDIISLLPFDVIYFFLSYKHAYLLIPALRLNKLLRFSRIIEFRNITETKTKYPTVFRMSNLLINIMMVMHWNACVYFSISRLIGFGTDVWVFPGLTEPDDLKNMTQIQLNNVLETHKLDVQYIYCFWWSVLLLTTIAEVITNIIL